MTIVNERAYLTFKPISHMIYLSSLESVPGTNRYPSMRVKVLAKCNYGSLWWGSNARL